MLQVLTTNPLLNDNYFKTTISNFYSFATDSVNIRSTNFIKNKLR